MSGFLKSVTYITKTLSCSYAHSIISVATPFIGIASLTAPVQVWLLKPAWYLLSRNVSSVVKLLLEGMAKAKPQTITGGIGAILKQLARSAIKD